MQFAYLEMLEPRLIVLSLSVVLGVVLLFAMVGPLGTDDDLRAVARLAYWGSCACVCWPICHAQDTVTLYFMRIYRPRLIVLITTAGALFLAIPCAAVTYALRELFGTGNRSGPTLGEAYLIAAPVLVAVISLVHYVACQRVKLRAPAGPAGAGTARPSTFEAARPSSAHGKDTGEPPVRPAPAGPRPPSRPDSAAAEGAARSSGGRARPDDLRPRLPQHSQRSLPGAAPGTDSQQRFLQSLPGGLDTDIVRIKADEHYIEVITARGSALVLKRFTDAVTELGALGMRVHRSHWVAHRHVARLVRDQHRTTLRLDNGDQVPVSRTYLSAVRHSLQQERQPKVP